MNNPETVQTCGNCRYYFEGGCHFASPLAIDRLAFWPKVELKNWCGRWKKPSELLPASLRASDGAIIAMMDVAGEIEYDEFVLQVAREFGIHEKSAAVKIKRLILRGKLDDNEGQIALALPRRKKTRSDPPLEAAPMGRPVKNDFMSWRDVLKIPFGNEEDAGTYSEFRDTANQRAPISNGSFSHMLWRAIRAGQVRRTKDKKYWVPPLDEPPAIEIP